MKPVFLHKNVPLIIPKTGFVATADLAHCLLDLTVISITSGLPGLWPGKPLVIDIIGRPGSRTTPLGASVLGALAAFETVPHGGLLATPPGPYPIGRCRCRTQARAGEPVNSDRNHCERQPASPVGPSQSGQYCTIF